MGIELIFPSCGCSLFSYLPTLLLRHSCSSGFSASASRLGGSALDVIGFEFLSFFAGRYPHDLDGVADYVGRALLAPGSTRHHWVLSFTESQTI
jgi:hypothetical protein